MMQNNPARYEIGIAEHLDERLAKWFGELEIVYSGESDETILRGELADQAALFGVIGKIRDLGLTLISVRRVKAIDRPPVVVIAPNPDGPAEEGR